MRRYSKLFSLNGALTTGAGEYVPVPCVPDYRRWRVYDGIQNQVKRGRRSGYRWRKYGKSQHTDFNKDTTNESTSVACSNVRLWKLDNQKKWRNTSWRLWDERAEKILRVSWTAKKTNEWVLNKAGVKRELLHKVKARKLAYYGHIMRKQGSCLEKEIMQGTMPGARMQVRKTTHGLDGHWKSQSEWQRTEIDGESTSMVWPTLGSRTAKEQNIKYSCQNSVRTAHKLSASAPNYKPKSTHSASSVILSVAAEVHSSRLVSCVVTDARNSNQTIKYTRKTH